MPSVINAQKKANILRSKVRRLLSGYGLSVDRLRRGKNGSADDTDSFRGFPTAMHRRESPPWEDSGGLSLQEANAQLMVFDDRADVAEGDILDWVVYGETSFRYVIVRLTTYTIGDYVIAQEAVINRTGLTP